MSDYYLYKHSLNYSGPLYKEQKLDEKTCSSLLHDNKEAFFIRNVYDFDTPQKTHFWYLIKEDADLLENYSYQMRRHIKKAMSQYTIKKISKSYIQKNGYDVYCSASKNYKVKSDVLSKHEFEKDIENKSDSCEYWAAFEKTSDVMEAYMITKPDDLCCEYMVQKATQKARLNYCCYYLIYQLNLYYLKDMNLSFVNAGARSITNHSNVQSFLEEKFNFRKAYCQLNVVYQWWLKPIVNVLFPFRKIIPNNKIKALLNLEAMKRGLI